MMPPVEVTRRYLTHGISVIFNHGIWWPIPGAKHINKRKKTQEQKGKKIP